LNRQQLTEGQWQCWPLVESDNEIFHEVLDDAIEAVSNADVQYVMMAAFLRLPMAVRVTPHTTSIFS